MTQTRIDDEHDGHRLTTIIDGPRLIIQVTDAITREHAISIAANYLTVAGIDATLTGAAETHHRTYDVRFHRDDWAALIVDANETTTTGD